MKSIHVFFKKYEMFGDGIKGAVGGVRRVIEKYAKIYRK